MVRVDFGIRRAIVRPNGPPPLNFLATTLDPYRCPNASYLAISPRADGRPCLIAAGSLLTVSPATAAPIAGAPTTYCGDPDTDPSMDTGAGTMITCDTTVTNTITAIDPGTGVASGSAVIEVGNARASRSAVWIPLS